MSFSSEEVKAGVVGAVVAVVLAAIPSLIWLGALQSRLEQLESGVWIKEARNKLLEELRATMNSEAAIAVQSSAQTQSTQKLSAAFTEPPEGAGVDVREMARGTSGDLRTGAVLWVFVFSIDASRYFPQSKKADVQLDGRWASLVQIGDNRDHGKRFDLILAEVDASGATAIAEYLENSAVRSLNTGMEDLPFGARVVARVPVSRNPIW